MGAHSNLGIVLHDQGKLSEAESCFRRAIKNDPGAADAYTNLGVLLREKGWLVESEACCRRALAIKPDCAKTYNCLGCILQALGKLDDALESYRRALQIKPDYAEVLNNLGVTLQGLGRREEAVASYRGALNINPDFAEAHYNQGLSLKSLGQLEDAVACYCSALKIKPDFAEAHNNLSSALQNIGQYNDAMTSARRALEIKPDFIEAHIGLGNALRSLAQQEEAVASYRRALEIKPDFALAHSNLGVTLQDLGLLDEAEACYRRALEIKPDYLDALSNLAILLIAQGKQKMALKFAKQSLQINETGVAKRIFVNCVKSLRCSQGDSGIREEVIRALIEPWARPSELTQIGIDLVKLNPDIKECISRTNDAWPLRLSAQELIGSNNLNALDSDRLLCALLNSAPISDIEIEHFLSMARYAMLEAASEISAGDECRADYIFYSALARQCFINEYVYSQTDGEFQKASDLREVLIAALDNNIQVPAIWVVALAAYFPLNTLPHAARLLERRWQEGIAAVLRQQVSEPAEELQLRATLPKLTSIEDEVSLLVQSQYEENPYPRWEKAEPAGKTMNIAGYFGQKFPLAPYNRLGNIGNIDLLIAGCGTGQHSIEVAQQFECAQVLAVDLSLSSLGYAKRKTIELGLNSIEYGQADLLKLGSLGRSFDVIESVGVLHHLADPWAGWKVLLSLLRPGGFMRLGFYSEIARRNVVRIRDYIAEQGYGSSADEIRRCRQYLVDLDKIADFGNTLTSPDFFSISACRDLLFHVQEHRMTLTGIEAFLRGNNLAFIGFEIDANILRAYQKRFPDDLAATNLAQWHIFENENPNTFCGMYQFWVQKN